MRESFQSIKEYLGKTPSSTFHKVGKILYLYLAFTERAFIVILVVDREGKQQHVYYVSHSLTRAQQRYPPIHKLEFTIRMASKKLRHYFGAHKIVILTSYPLKNILGKLKQSGRLS